jgi:xanthine dehydrogenase YagR molybdenum-binding subunit
MTRQLLGDPLDRVDGPLKVTGAAPYPSDVTLPGLAHAALVQSTIAAGRIARIDTRNAEAIEGVLAVISHRNAPGARRRTDDGVRAVLAVPAQGRSRAAYRTARGDRGRRDRPAGARGRAARRGRIRAHGSDPRDRRSRAPVMRNLWGLEMERGDVAAALAAAEIVYDETFTTNNPLGLFATVAEWDGARLTVHDSTQWPMLVRTTLATMFGIPERDVRVRVPYLGGGFGAGLRVWPHTVLAALAARVVARPVKLVLTRPQMFWSTGHRPETVQRVRLGAAQDGRLVALDHEATSTVPVNADVPELDVVFVGEPDRFNPTGTKGLGEVGVVGVAAAIANAIYHATGRRIRSLPITLDKLL